MDSVEYAREHEQLEPVRNVHAPSSGNLTPGHAAFVRLVAPYTEEKTPLFTVTKLQMKLLGSVGYVEPSPLHDVENGAHWILGQAKARKQGSEFTKRQLWRPASCTMIAVIALGCTSSCSPHT